MPPASASTVELTKEESYQGGLASKCSVVPPPPTAIMARAATVMARMKNTHWETPPLAGGQQFATSTGAPYEFAFCVTKR